MSMTIGRCTLTEDPYNQRWEGDDWSFDIEVVGAAQAGTVVDDFKAKVQQLRGLMDNEDEDVFPVTWSEDATVDGFYDSFRVSMTPLPVYLATGVGVASISCRRIAGAAAAQFENTATWTTMTNGLGLPTASTPLSVVGIPYTSAQLGLISDSAGNTSEGLSAATLTTSDGLVRTFGLIGTATTIVERFTWTTAPAYYYEASAQFEQSYGGTYYALVGQHSRTISNAWRISNGLVRVVVSGTTIQVSHYDGSAWDTAKSWTLSSTGGTVELKSVSSVRVLRNTPHTVAIRLGVVVDTSNHEGTLDISLRRGARFAAFTFRYVPAPQAWWIDNNEAGSALTGGIVATSTDASGNKYVVGSAAAQTNTLATGRLQLTSSSTSFSFMIGSDVGAAGLGQSQLNCYIDSISEDQRVISR